MEMLLGIRNTYLILLFHIKFQPQLFFFHCFLGNHYVGWEKPPWARPKMPKEKIVITDHYTRDDFARQTNKRFSGWKLGENLSSLHNC